MSVHSMIPRDVICTLECMPRLDLLKVTILCTNHRHIIILYACGTNKLISRVVYLSQYNIA